MDKLQIIIVVSVFLDILFFKSNLINAHFLSCFVIFVSISIWIYKYLNNLNNFFLHGKFTNRRVE